MSPTLLYIKKKLPLVVILLFSPFDYAFSQATLHLQMDKKGAGVSRKLYGLMSEEINYSCDGGRYAELIRKRTFKDNPKNPGYWCVVKDKGSTDSLKPDNKQPINSALTIFLLLNVQQPGKREGIADAGYWGIPVKPPTTYKGSFSAKTDNAAGPLHESVESNDGKQTRGYPFYYRTG